MNIGLIHTPYSRDTDLLEHICRAAGHSVKHIWYAEPDLAGVQALIAADSYPAASMDTSAFPLSVARLRYSLQVYADHDGHILGLGSGFALLLSCGLLSGQLLGNLPRGFVCQQQYVSVTENFCPGLGNFARSESLLFPIAHGAGRYIPESGQVDAERTAVLRYCDPDQNIHSGTCPDGSWRNAAGVSSQNGRVLGTQLRPDLGYFHEEEGRDSRRFFAAFFKNVAELERTG